MNINIKKYGQGKPLILFHGWGFDSQIWLPIIPLLQGKYQLILVDLPGFGFTPMMNWDQFKETLLAKLPRKFAVVGWSLGGLFATRLAIEASDRVNFLINVASSPRFIADPMWPGVHHELMINFHKNLTIDINKTLIDFIALQVNNNPLSFKQGATPSREALEHGLNILESWDLREGLKSLRQPACFMFGRLDRIIPVKTMQTMQLIYPGFRYVFFNKAAHMPFLSHSESFIIEISEFIK